MIKSLFEEEYLLGHKCGDKQEILNEHAELTKKYYDNILKTHEIEDIYENLFNELKLKPELMSKNLKKIVYWHDAGKINPLYQSKILNNNEKFNNLSDKLSLKIDSNHGLLSSVLIVYELLKNKGDEFKNNEKEISVILLMSLIVAFHHTKLQDMNYKIIEDKIKDIKEDIKKIGNFYDVGLNEELIEYITLENSLWRKLIDKIIPNCFNENQMTSLFLFIKLFNSLLISSDYYATLEFNSGEEVSFEESVLSDKISKQIIENFHKNNEIEGNFNPDINKNRNKYEEIELDNIKDLDEINEVRNWLNIYTEKELEENINEKKVFFLNLPTGAGKTNISFRLALKILKNNYKIKNIYYVFPFVNIIEQAYNSLEKFIPEDEDKKNLKLSTRYDYRAPLNIKNEEDDLKKIDFDLLFQNYPIGFMSNVKFFNMVFKNSKSDNYAFYKLSNSIVILDEIQSYDDNLWAVLAECIRKISNLFNIYFIIMSATLPEIDELIKQEKEVMLEENKENQEFAYRIVDKPSKIYNHKVFKRLRYDFDKNIVKESKKSINSKKDINKKLKKIEDVLNKNKHKKILVVTNTVGDSFDLFTKIKDKYKNKDDKILLLNSTFLEFDRRRIINTIKRWNNDENRIILISTQTIEAGVDLDFDIGIRFYSPLDSIVQVGGRINRNNKNSSDESILYVFSDKNYEYVYKGNYKSLVGQEEGTLQNISNDLNFDHIKSFYENIIEKIKHDNRSFILKNTKENINNLRSLCFSKLSEIEIVKNLNSIPVFIKTEIKLSNNKSNEYIEHLKQLSKLLGLENFVSEDNAHILLDSEILWDYYVKLINNSSTNDFFHNRMKIKYLQKLMGLFTTNVVIRNKKDFILEYGYYVLEKDNKVYSNVSGINKEALNEIGWFI